MKINDLKRVCIICKNSYMSNYSQQKVCSDECYLAFRRSKYNAMKRNCIVCSEVFIVNLNTKNSKVCSKICKEQVLKNKKEKLKKITVKACIICNMSFNARGSKLTCSNSCSKQRVLNVVNSKYNNNINFKLSDILRSRLYHAISNNQKVGSAVRDLGCSVTKLKIHLQLQFHRNPRGKHEYMTWDNHSLKGWHIDHIKPLSSFDLSNPKQLKEACHYTNLQPLWARENLVKSDNLNE